MTAVWVKRVAASAAAVMLLALVAACGGGNNGGQSDGSGQAAAGRVSGSSTLQKQPEAANGTNETRIVKDEFGNVVIPKHSKRVAGIRPANKRSP